MSNNSGGLIVTQGDTINEFVRDFANDLCQVFECTKAEDFYRPFDFCVATQRANPIAHESLVIYCNNFYAQVQIFKEGSYVRPHVRRLPPHPDKQDWVHHGSAFFCLEDVASWVIDIFNDFTYIVVWKDCQQFCSQMLSKMGILRTNYTILEWLGATAFSLGAIALERKTRGSQFGLQFVKQTLKPDLISLFKQQRANSA